MRNSRSWRLPLLAVLAALLSFGGLSSVRTPAVSASAPPDGSVVHLGSPVLRGHGRTMLVPVYLDGDVVDGEPDFWAYCIENRVDLKTDREGVAGGWDSFLGDNYFATDPVAGGKVAWILVHSFPALDVAELSAMSGVDGLTQADAIEATQYAIWRFTDLSFDASWSFENQRTEDLYWYLVAGAHAHGGYSESDLAALGGSVTLTGPTSMQAAGTLAGPFVVSTDQPAASISVDPALAVTDVDGEPVDPSVAVDGQEFYVDLGDETASGSGTVTASVESRAGTGMIVSVDAHLVERAQTLMLVAAAGATVDASAPFEWNGQVLGEPSIRTTVAVEGSDEKVLPLSGGTVVDTVRYEGLTPGVEYVLEGSIRLPADGAETGITGSTTFVAQSESASVDVIFTISGDDVAAYAGQELVVFEQLTRDGELVAEHVDPSDQDQTFRVASSDEEPDETTTTTDEVTTTTGAGDSTTVETGPGVDAPAGSGTGGDSNAGGAGSLARTGSDSLRLAVIGSVLAVGGASVLRLRRRNAAS